MKGRKKVFLIDDDDLIIAMLTRALKKDGYEVHSETRTEDIVSKVKGWAPDVVMLDINLPGRSGIDILQDLKAEAGPEVIMLTADDTVETAVKAMKIGAADYLTKPFNIEEVKIVIGNIVEKGKLKTEVQYLRGLYCETFRQELIGDSAAMRELKARILRMAESRVPTILVSGESG